MKFKTASETRVEYPILDIADSKSVQSFAKKIQEKHGHVGVLINNAGVNLDDNYSPENVKDTLNINVRGTLDVRFSFTYNKCDIQYNSLLSIPADVSDFHSTPS